MASNYQVPPRFLHHHRLAPPPFDFHQPPLAASETFSYYFYDIPQYLSQIVAAENAARYEYMRFFQPGPPPRFRNIPANNHSYNHSYDDQGYFSPYGLSPSFYIQEEETMLFEDFDAVILGDQNISYGGLSEEIIDRNMKTRSIIGKHDKDDEVCVICQDDFQEDQKIGILDNCVHECHAQCMKDWLMQKNICPICKANGLDIV